MPAKQFKKNKKYKNMQKHILMVSALLGKTAHAKVGSRASDTVFKS